MTLLLLASLAHATPCLGAECSVVADVAAVTAVTAAPAVAPPPAPEVWSGYTQVDPDDFAARGLRPEVLRLALTAYATARSRVQTTDATLTVVDYSLPSDQKRLWVIELDTGRLRFHEHTAHGVNSGARYATNFSNTDSSRRSNLGLMRTAETYSGKHGYSLRLDGLEGGYNNNARSRDIVMHSATYMTDDFIRRRGRAGTSWGCPALDPDISRAVIDAIKGGSLIFGYYPDADWLRGSTYLGAAGDAAAADLPPPTLRRGDEGPAVERLQVALKAAGFYSGGIDGDFGRGTRRALERFQRARGLTADGVADATTWEALSAP